MAVEKLTFEMNAVGNAVPEMKKVQAQLGSLDKTMNKSTANMNRHVRGMQGVGKANKNMTRSLGMASLQFQDMAVQASMGTDALRIMTMQGPQLASIFGPKGMIVGALIAVGGAIAMMGDKTTKLTFDFQKLGKDIKPAFQPLIDFVKPAIDAVGRAFTFLKNLGMIAINGIVNGIQAMAIFISNVPSIVREAFSRAAKSIELFKTNALIFFNEIEFTFLVMISNMAEKFLRFTNTTAKEINRAFGTALPEDMGANAFENLQQRIDENILGVLDLTRKSDGLRAELDKPYESITNLKDDLENMTKIDLFSYFDRVKVKGDETANELAKITTVADMMSDKFGDAFMSVVDGSKKGKDAFRAMASDIIKELYRVFVVKRITGFISGALESAFPSLATPMKAIGGPVQAGNPYIVGERGPELFVPSRTGSIVSNDKMGGGGGVTVVQNINVSTGVQQTVRTEIKSLMPQIAESAKSAVMDAKRRGGSYGRSFA